MFCHKCKCCKNMWLSGFFALGAIVHALRFVARVPMQLANWPVPMALSVVVVVVAGALSFIFCKKGCGACSCSSAPKA